MRRTLALALVLAAAGFCYATSSGSRSLGGIDGGPAAGGRGVGTTPLRFTNVLLRDFPYPQADVYDLGDACYGSVVTRYVTVAGGVRPYSYNQLGLAPPILAANSSLTLHPSGLLMGTIAGGTTPPLVFQVNASDSFGTQPNGLAGLFAMNLYIYTPTVFRFGTDRLNNGVLGQHYISKLETLCGSGNVQFSVLPNTLTVNGAPKGVSGALEAIGLSLAADGTVYGRPLEGGRMSFVARAVDANKRTATNRTDEVQDQVVTFSIEENGTTATDYTTLSCRAKGDVGQYNKDSIAFSGVVNLSGTSFNSLVGSRFEFRLGGASFAGYLNARGKVVNERGGPVVYADSSRLSVSLNPRTGQLKGSVSKASLGKLLDGINVANNSSRNYAVGITFAKFVVASDMLEFVTRKSNDKFMLDYNLLGKLGRPLGGAFQLLNVKGVDKNTISGQQGVAWAAKFIMAPRYGVDASAGLDAVNILGVRIGNLFEQRISSKYLTSSNNGTIKLVKHNYQGEYVNKLSYSTRKFTGSLVTQPLSHYTTGLAAAKKAPSATNFTLGLDLDRGTSGASFSGEAAKSVAPVAGKGYWVDQSNLRK